MSEAATKRGLFITLEGVDGSGKTTQARLLDEWLRAEGRSTVLTREPGGTELGRLVRDIVLHHRGEIEPRAEALLFAADRAQHIGRKVRPALERGEVVIQDRYIDSSVAFQGAGRVLNPETVRLISEWATEDLVPDLTIVLDLDASEARARIAADGKVFDRIEAEAIEFSQRVRAAFLAMADAEPERFLVLDASASEAELARGIRERVEPLLAR